jgi:vacuolar protein sorting-associated protein 41
MVDYDGSDNFKNSSTAAPNSHPCLEAMAGLRMMQGRYDLALKCFLAISACHSSHPLESFEKTAVDIVNSNKVDGGDEPIRIGATSYDYVMGLIEGQHLNQFLLQKDFLQPTDAREFMPLFALLRLVGFQRLGAFLIEHCVSPDYYYDTTLREANTSRQIALERDQDSLRREPLPIDKIAGQFGSSPALLYWYLHLVLKRRPDVYVRFPTNSIPSKAATSLHRRHFQLYVDFAGENRDSSKALAGIESYKVEAKTTPLLSFLKAALPLGGVVPVDARRVLEIERSKAAIDRDEGGSKGDSDESSSPIFALELAYIIENYSELTEADAVGVLNLYLLGARSLMLSVLYAQRQHRFSSILWGRLITYCLSEASDGGLFGELLEAAALSGADLARLVASIPPGMNVEGLRPRLVAAVADYRMKLEIYTAAAAAGSEDEVALMREIAQRSRRGVRYYMGKIREKSFAELIQEKNKEDEGTIGEKISEDLPTSLPKSLRTDARRDHNYLAYSIPRR